MDYNSADDLGQALIYIIGAALIFGGIILLSDFSWKLKLALSIPFCLIFLIAFLAGDRSCRVDAVYEVDDETLLLEKDGLREKLRLDNIVNVSYQRGDDDFRSSSFGTLPGAVSAKPPCIFLFLRAPCSFGKVIEFFAPGEVPRAFAQHSLVTYLKRKAGII